MSHVFFAGDLHVAHKNICKYRTEFPDLDTYHSYLYEQFKSVGTKRDTLYLTGDIVFGRSHFDFMADMVSHFGKVVPIIGNHDTEHDFGVGDLETLFGFRAFSALRYKEFWITHVPMHPHELRGHVNIHGHVHTHTITVPGVSNLEDPRYFNTSLENINYVPIELGEIRAQRRDASKLLKEELENKKAFEQWKKDQTEQPDVK